MLVDRDSGLIAFLQGDQTAPPPLNILIRRHPLTGVRWLTPERIEIVAQTAEDAPDSVRSWRAVGSLNVRAGSIAWDASEELTEAEYQAAMGATRARRLRVLSEHGVPGGQPWVAARDSWGGEFAGTFVGDTMVSGQPGPGSSNITFVAFVDENRFAYPLGHMERPFTSYLSFSWDMVRVD